MKSSCKILSLFLMGLVFFSCKKDELPKVEIYVSSEKSDLYQNVKMQIWSVRFFQDSGAGVSSPVSKTGKNLDFMGGESPVLIYNNSVFKSKFESFGLNLSNIQATTLEGNTVEVIEFSENFDHYFEYELLPNNRYRIDIIYDFDLSISINGPNISFYPIAEIKIAEI